MKHSLRIANKHSWKRWGVLPLLLSIALTFLIVASVSAAVTISATKTYTFIGGDGDGKADPGETIEYTVVITNSGSTDATGVGFDDNPDANTTFVPGSIAASPVAVNDTYPQTVIGNVSIDSSLISYSVLTNDFLGLNPTATITAFDAITVNGGQVTMNAAGQFTYNPPVGYEGTDTFNYTLSNATGSNTGTVSIPVSGMVWFINNNAGACSSTCNGRLSNPFTTLAAFNTANGLSGGLNPDNNDNIFIYESSAAYSGGVTLRSGQKLIGQDSTQSLSTITGLTPPTGSASFPAMNTGAPATTVQNSGGDAVTINEGNTIRGLTISGTSGAGIKGTNRNALTVGSDVATTGVSGADLDLSGGNGLVNFGASVTNSTGRAISIQNRTGNNVNLTGAISDSGGTGVLLNNNTFAAITFSGGVSLSTGTNAAFTATGGGTVNVCDESPCNPGATGGLVNTLTTTTGTALNVANTTIGSNKLEFRSISVTGNDTLPSSGIVMDATGTTGGLKVSGNGGSCTPATPTCTGGTIQGTGSHGVSLTNVSNIEFNLMSIHNTGDHGIFGNGVNNFTYRDGRIFDFGNTAGAGVSEDAMHFESTNTANTAAGHGLTGIVIIQRDTIGPDSNFSLTPNPPLPENKGIVIRNHNDVDVNMTVTGTTFSQISNDGIDAEISNDTDATAGHGTGTINVDGSTADGANTFSQINGRAVNFQNPVDNVTARAFDLFVKNNVFNHVGIGGRWLASGRGTMNARYNNNAMTFTYNDAIRSESDAVNAALTPHATVNATVSNNTMGGGSIFISLHRQAVSSITFTNNTNIGGTAAGSGGCASCTGVQTGMNLRSDRGSTLNIDVVNNTGTADGSLAFAQSALDLQATTNAGGNSTICAKVTSNTLTENPDTAGQQVISIDPVGGSTIIFEGGPGNSPGTENFLIANNTLNGTNKVAISDPSKVPSGVGADCVTSVLAQNQVETNPMALAQAASTGVNSTNAFTIASGSANTFKQASWVEPQDAAVNASAALLTDNRGGDGSKQASWVNPSTALLTGDSGGSMSPPSAPAQSGGIVSVNIGTLPASKSVTIKFRVIVDDPLPLGTTRLLNQGTVSGSNFSSVSTTDPSPNPDPACVGAGTQTCTPVDRPDTTVSSILRNSSTPTNASSISWTVTFPDQIISLTSSNFTLVNGGLGGTPAITSVTPNTALPATQWTVTASTGTGNGTLGLNMANDTGLSHDVTNLPFTGQVYTIDRTPPTVTINQAAGQADPTNSSPINFKVIFSEPVTGFATGDVTLSGTAGATTATVTEIAPNDGTTYNVAVSGMTSDGTVIATIAAGMAQDTATNTNTASTSTDNTVTYDTTAPTVTINQAVGQADPTNSSPINFTVVFNESVTGFATGDVTLSGTAGATTATVTGSGTTYTVAVSGMTGDGTIIASIAVNKAQDAAANGNSASTSTDNTVTFDTTAPSVTINQAAGQADPTNSSPISFTVVFNEPVTGFATGDVSLTGTGGATTGTVTENAPMNGTTYNVSVSGMTSDGTVIASIAVNKAQDAAANGNSASTSTDNTVTYDTTAPSVTINQAAGQADPASTSPVNFTVVFNESVTGFTTGDVTLSGTAGATTATVTGSGTTYNVAVSGMTGDGTVIASIGAGVAQDAATNGNSASTSTDNTVTFDTTAPSVTINQAVGQADPTNSSPINFTVVFNESVTGFATGDVTLSGTAGATTATVTGSGTTYNVAVSGMTTDGTVIATVPAGVAQDVVANSNSASTSTDNTVTFDTTAPSVTINQAVGQADPTNSSPISFTVVFNEPVTGFTATDVTLSGTAGATTVTVTGSGTTYNVAVSGMTTDGTVIATVPASVALDLAGNGNSASTSTDNTVTYDTTVPTVTINQAAGQADPTNSSPISFTVVFNEPVTGFTATDVTLSGTAGATTATVTGSGTTYTVAVSGMTTDGTVIATVPAGVAQDAATNGNSASTSTDNTVAYDSTAPTVTSNQAVGQADPTGVSPINFTVVFDEPVTGFATGDVTLSGTAGATTATVTGSGTTYTVAVSGMTGDGTVIASIGVGVATDAAANGNSASTSTDNTVTYDTTAPSVTINQAVGQADPTNSSPISFTVVFNEPVTGFTATDVTLSGTAGATTVTVAGSGTTYNVAVSGMTTDGTVIATVPAGVAQDAATNSNSASTSTDNTVTFDTTAPTVTSNQAVGQADPTGVSPINFTVVFDEPVTNFIAADITLGGTAPGTLSATISGGPTTYNVAVSGMTGGGTVTTAILAGAVTDLAGNINTASTSTDNTVMFDPVVPAVTGIARADPSPTSAASVRFIVTFSKSVSGVDATDFTFITSGVTGAAITGITGSGTTMTVTLNTGTGDGTLRMNLIDDDTIVDGAGNPLGGTGAGNGTFTSGEVYTIDKTAPSVASVVRAGANPTNAATVVFNVTFSEVVTGVDTGDFSLATSGVTGAAITTLTGSGATRTVTVNTGSGSGMIGLNIVDNDTIVDVIGNSLGGTGPGNGSFTGQVYTIDKTAPQAGNLVVANVTTGGAPTHPFTVVVSDNLAIDVASLDGSDIRVTGPGGFTQLATLVGVTPATNGTPRTATYRITTPGGSWDSADNGSYTVALQANQVRDTVGNPVAASVLGTFSVNINVARHTAFLPMVLRPSGTPDLVASISIYPNKRSFTAGEPVVISVTVTNQGDAAAGQFWVDLFINPSAPPTQANVTWNQTCTLTPCYGIAWLVPNGLAPGASITLSSQSVPAGYSVWPGYFAAGTTDLYVYADSWNPGVATGAVAESNETNNSAHLGGLTVTGPNPSPVGPTDADLRQRPAPGKQ